MKRRSFLKQAVLAGGAVEESFLTDSLLGEAMGLRPIVLMAAEIQTTPALKEKFGPRADAWLTLAGQVFEKWDSRGCWREVTAGGLWVVAAFGLDAKTGRWKDSPGTLWTALVPHDATLRQVFLQNHHPASWGGLAVTPWFLAREAAGSSSRL